MGDGVFRIALDNTERTKELTKFPTRASTRRGQSDTSYVWEGKGMEGMAILIETAAAAGPKKNTHMLKFSLTG